MGVKFSLRPLHLEAHFEVLDDDALAAGANRGKPEDSNPARGWSGASSVLQKVVWHTMKSLRAAFDPVHKMWDSVMPVRSDEGRDPGKWPPI